MIAFKLCVIEIERHKREPKMNLLPDGFHVFCLVFPEAVDTWLDALLDIPPTIPMRDKDTSLSVHKVGHETQPYQALIAENAVDLRGTQELDAAWDRNQAVVLEAESSAEKVLKMRLEPWITAVNHDDAGLFRVDRLGVIVLHGRGVYVITEGQLRS